MHGYTRERKEIPNDVKHLTLHFCYAKAYRCHFMNGRQQRWDGYLCLSLICPCMICLKENNMQRKNKSKKNQNVLYMIASMSSRRCGSYRMYLESDSPHQAVMIVCELKRFLISQIVITCIHLCNLAMFFIHNTQYSLLLLIHVQVQCDLSITRFYMC